MDKNLPCAPEAAKEGFVLTPAFARSLANVYEKQDVVLRLRFPDMVEQLDSREERRASKNIQFATEAGRPHDPRHRRKAAAS